RMLSLGVLWAIPTPIAEVLGVAVIGGLILVGQHLGVGLAALAAFLAVLYRLQGPVREFLSCRVALDSVAAAVEDVDSFLAQTRAPYLENGSMPAPAIRHGVEFRKVSFRYAPDEALALADLDLSFPAGKT